MKKNIMLDLETLGKEPKSVIVSIGAVEFSETEVTENKFYINIDPEDCQSYGLKINASTFLWWMGQSAAARLAITGSEKVKLKEALTSFSSWLLMDSSKDDVIVWGNGSDFDNTILSSSYSETGLEQPWSFRNNRCYRTIKNLFPDIKIETSGTRHNALDDAISQAHHLVKTHLLSNDCPALR